MSEEHGLSLFISLARKKAERVQTSNVAVTQGSVANTHSYMKLQTVAR